MRPSIDIIGLKSGKLTVVKKILENRNGKLMSAWICNCECGNTKKITQTNPIRMERLKSCGCINKNGIRLRHGLSKTKTHNAWCGMKYRCYNSRASGFEHYGGKGIKVCYRWLQSFDNFLEDMGECPSNCSIERINSDKDYEPENCRWASKVEQNNNTSRNRIIEWNGKKQSLVMWSRELNINQDVLRARLDKLGWSLDDALTKCKRGCSHDQNCNQPV